MEVQGHAILLKNKATGHILLQLWGQIIFKHVHIYTDCRSTAQKDSMIGA
jgi:hypothetical protein